MSSNYTREEVLRKLFLIASIVVVVTLPLPIKFNGASIIFLSLVWILESNWKLKYEKLRNNQFAVLAVAFYIIHIIGLAYTDNIEQGFDELEKRVAFVAFPVIFATTSFLSRRFVLIILACFVGTCFLAVAVCVIHGLYFYVYHGTDIYLFYHNLGTPIDFTHAIYFSFYVGFAIFISLFFITTYWARMNAARRTASVFVVVFLSVALFLLSSKTLIPTVFALLAWFFGRMLSRKVNRVAGIAMLLALLIIPLLTVVTVPNIRERFKEVLYDKYDQTNPLLLDDYAQYHFTAGAIRLAIWKMSVEVINEKRAWLHGVGTGDSQDELTHMYIRKHVYPGDKELGTVGFLHYNAHNQFMQFFVTFGLIGLIFFLYWLLVLFKYAFSHSNLLVYFLLLFSAFSLTESTLYVQKGIVAFCFFASLLTATKQNLWKVSAVAE